MADNQLNDRGELNPREIGNPLKLIHNRTNEVPHFATINCKEKIILCLDISSNLKKAIAHEKGNVKSLLAIIKNSVSTFMYTKNSINAAHEFALMILTDSATWCHGFTNNPADLMSLINDLDANSKEPTAVDLGAIFSSIEAEGIEPTNVEDDVPEYVVRLVLLYTRKELADFVSEDRLEVARKLLGANTGNNYFFVDVILIHDHKSNEIKQLKDLSSGLAQMDVNGLGYFLVVKHDYEEIQNAMTRLLAHPLQRALQRHAIHDVTRFRV